MSEQNNFATRNPDQFLIHRPDPQTKIAANAAHLGHKTRKIKVLGRVKLATIMVYKIFFLEFGEKQNLTLQDFLPKNQFG